MGKTQANHPYNTTKRYEFNAANDDTSLLDETTTNKVRKAIVYDTFAEDKAKININRKKFCDGFRLLFKKLKKRIESMGGKVKDLAITDFKIISFDKIIVYINQLETGEALFPVDLEYKNPLIIKRKAYKVSINVDNPTALAGANMDGGPQGTHFGYSIKSLDNEFIGHVLINTFVGFPTRDKNNLDNVNVISQQNESIKFSELNNILQNAKYVIPYDLIRISALPVVLIGHPASMELKFPVLDDYFAFNSETL